MSAGTNALKLKWHQATSAVFRHHEMSDKPPCECSIYWNAAKHQGMSGNTPQRTNSPSSGSPAHIGERPAQLNLALKNVAEELAIDER